MMLYLPEVQMMIKTRPNLTGSQLMKMKIKTQP